MTYGDAAPTVTPSFGGFVLSDDAGNSLSTQPTCTTTYTAGSPVSGSPYATKPHGRPCRPTTPRANASGSVTVNKKGLTITASSHTVTYGDAAPTVTPSFAGFFGARRGPHGIDGPAHLLDATCTQGSAAGGSYPTSSHGAAAANYAISYVSGTLTMDKAALVVTASNATSTYGQAPPAIRPPTAGS